MSKRAFPISKPIGFASCLAALLLLAPPGHAQSKKNQVAQRKAAQPTPTNEKNRTLEIQKSATALPQSAALKSPEMKPRSLETVKPPSSREFTHQGETKEAEYERILDQQIATLFKISQNSKRAENRGELWLRLAELYVEKARLVDFRAQAEYEVKLKDYLARKTKVKPKVDTRLTREYHEKSVQLYEWFVRDFPKDPKMDQALFFLGYNHFELNNTKQGEKFYTDLVTRFPDSVYVMESRFALGEYYFENDKWRQALDNYARVVKARKARLNTFALYKSAWCLYRLGDVRKALAALERVILLSRSNEGGDGGPGRKSINKFRLASEAQRDYVPFYAEAGDPEQAFKEFERISGDDKKALQMGERLAFIYADQGNRKAATYMFKQLIARNPSGEKAAEYQYQIVLAYATYDQKIFRQELEVWLETFGPNSYWAKENAKNAKLVQDVATLQETTIRNQVLQLHQAAQNSRAPYSQQLASTGYAQYLKYFPNSPKAIEMQFFRAELLFDMQKYQDAAKLYTWVAEKDPKGPYAEKSIVNTLLALEKDLPTPAQIEAKRGKSLEKMELDPQVVAFEKGALKYIQAFPKGEKVPDIQRRLGVLYYSYNHFDKAIDIFDKIIRENPKSNNAEVAGNLTLDIYNMRNDMEGFTVKGEQYLANPAIAGTGFGKRVKAMMETARYTRLENMEKKGGDSLKVAKEYEAYANANMGEAPKAVELRSAARYKAAIAYEKGGDTPSAVRMHNLVIGGPANNPKLKAAQNDSRNALARIYQQTGQLDLAARQYQGFAAANPNDPKTPNAYFNAGVLWESLGETPEAMKSYQAYYDMTDRSDKTEILFTQAEMLRKRGQMNRALPLYEKYLNAGPRNQAHAIQSVFLIAQNHERRNEVSKAKAQYQKVVEMYKRAPQQAKNDSVKYAAEARFHLAQETLEKLAKVRFGTTEKDQKQAAIDIKNLRGKYIDEMKEVIRFDYGPFIVAALASSGRMFDMIAGLFARIPIPKGLNAEETKQFQQLIQKQIEPFRIEAKNSYKAAVDKSLEVEAYTAWTKTAQSGLAMHDPASSADAGEMTIDSKQPDWLGI